MKEKLLKLCEDKEFAEKLNSLKTEAEVIEFLKSSGIEVNSIEELKAIMLPASGELNPGELNEAAGGIFCIGIGLGGIYNACWKWGEGYHNNSGDVLEGYGAAACFLIGVGAAAIIDR